MAWVEKRAKVWQGRYRDTSGRTRVAGSSPNKKIALQLAVKEETRVESGEWADPTAGKMLFSTYFTEHWIENRIMERNTRSKYESHYRSALEETFGSLELRKITRPLVQRWVTSMEKEGLSPGTIESKLVALQTILAATKGVSARRDGLISVNPCEGVTRPPIPPRTVQTYSVEETERLIAHLPPHLRPIVALDCESGLRWGELMGIFVSDFSKDFRVLTVQRTVIEGSKADMGGESRFSLKPYPKGGKPRKVALTDEAAAMVRTLVRERKLFPGDRLFSMLDDAGLPVRTKEWPTGLPISRSAMRYRWLVVHEELGIKQRRIHDLRASHISWLLAGGADIASVMERVGHQKLATTQVYVSAMSDADERTLDALKKTKKRAKKAKKKGKIA